MRPPVSKNIATISPLLILLPQIQQFSLAKIAKILFTVFLPNLATSEI
jgi:hypothetical protein